MPYERARKAPSTHLHDYIRPYVADLGNVVDMALVKSSGVKIGIDPLGGAAVHFWQPIIERYGINATSRERRGRSDLPLHDRRLGRQNPDGLFLAVRDGEPDPDARQVRRRVCQRHRCGPPRHRDAVRRPDEPEPFPGRPRSPICSRSGRNGARTPRSARPSSPVRSSIVWRRS